MEPSPAPHEGPAKAEDDRQKPEAMGRFRALARHLFAVDLGAYREASRKDEEERREKRRG